MRVGMPRTVALLALFAEPLLTDACTSIAVGRGATVEGSGLATHNNDCVECDPRVAFIAAKDHSTGAKRPIQGFRHAYPRVVGTDRSPTYAAVDGQEDTVPTDFISEVPHTYAYWESTYPMINEHGLGFGESTCQSQLVGLSKAQGGTALFCVGELMRVALERCHDARCAISLMGDLAVEYGFYGEDPGMGGAGESVTVVDSKETWVFHVTGGLHNASATWVAQRVPDDHVAVIANNFIIRGVDCQDPKNFLCSSNLFSNARALNCDFSTEAEFDFLRCYSADWIHCACPSCYYTTLRMWRIQSLANPEANIRLTEDPYDFPFSVPVNRKISRADVMNWTRDYYKDTPYDMSQGVLAGPHGNPLREEGGHGEVQVPGQATRGISILRTNSAVVVEGKSGAKAQQSIAWFATDQPISSVFAPFIATADRAAESYHKGHLETFSRESAFWAFNFVSNWMMLNWESMMSMTVGPVQSEEQGRIFAAVTALEAQWPKEKEAVNKFQQGLQQRLVERWWLLADDVIARHSDAIYTHQNGTKMGLGYTAWWLQMIGYDEGFFTVRWVAPSLMPPLMLRSKLVWFHAAATTFLASARDRVTSDGFLSSAVPTLIGVLVGAGTMSLIHRRQSKVSELSHMLLQ